jgi:(2Fe-2S) ferredoxin
VQVVIGEAAPVTYGKVTPFVMRQIMEQHVLGGKVVSDYVVPA